jgi:DnaD/phage-associated family protein
MNYIKELNAFRDWTLINQPSTGQVALWHSLMSVNNMTGWVEWFTVANQTLQLMTGLSRQGLDKARNQLCQKGLVEYKKGVSNQAGRYRVISFECQKVGTEVGTTVGMEGAPELSQKGRGGSTLFKLNETKQNLSSGGSSNAREIFTCFESEGFGTLTGLLVDRLNDLIDDYSEAWVLEAMKESAIQNKRSLSYITGILKRWRAEGIDEPWKGGKPSGTNRNQSRDDSETFERPPSYYDQYPNLVKRI